jgi:hypothetical protein
MRMAFQLLNHASQLPRTGRLVCGTNCPDKLLQLKKRSAGDLDANKIRPKHGQDVCILPDSAGHHCPDSSDLVGYATDHPRILAERQCSTGSPSLHKLSESSSPTARKIVTLELHFLKTESLAL